MFTDYSESESFNKKHINRDSENSPLQSDLNENEEDFKEFLEYVDMSIEKYENKVKDAYENIQNACSNPEQEKFDLEEFLMLLEGFLESIEFIRVIVNKFDFYIAKEEKLQSKICDMQNKILCLKERKKAMKIEIDNYIIDNEDKQQKLYDLEQIVINIQNENFELKHRYNEPKEIILKQKVSDSSSNMSAFEINALNEEKKKIILEKQNLLKRIESYEMKISNMNTITFNIEEKNKRLEEEKKKLIATNRLLENEINLLKRELIQIKSSNENLNKEINEIKYEKSSNHTFPGNQPLNAINSNTKIQEPLNKQKNVNFFQIKEVFKNYGTFNKKKNYLNRPTINLKDFGSHKRNHSIGSSQSNTSDHKKNGSSSSVNVKTKNNIPKPVKRKETSSGENFSCRSSISFKYSDEKKLNFGSISMDKINESNKGGYLTLGKENKTETNEGYEEDTKKGFVTPNKLSGNIVSSMLHKNISELNKMLSISEKISDDNINKNSKNRRRLSSKNHLLLNGIPPSSYGENGKYRTQLKDQKIIQVIRNVNSTKNTRFPHFNDFTENKNFFYMTFDSIKFNTERKDIFKDLDVNKLYKLSIRHYIPYYKYYKFIKNEVKNTLYRLTKEDNKIYRKVNSVMDFFETFLNLK